ncbi:uncharacterized protein [Danio rerio]|uniref:Uncharacterized protein n=2 Tax=Danio rerio TaxID=7955 RepID=A0AC58I5D0_DANRE
MSLGDGCLASDWIHITVNSFSCTTDSILLRMATPYSRPPPLHITCVKVHSSQKAVTFIKHENKIIVDTYKVTSLCALTDGDAVYLSIKNGSDPEFEEGHSYIVKNVTISNKYGRRCLFVNKGTIKFRTAPLAISEEAKRAAREALCPPSRPITGEEEDIFSETGYLSLRGQLEKVEVPRMTRTHIPILDLRMKCGSVVHDVSLWREEALNELYVGDIIELSHLKVNGRPDGRAKFDSSNHTTFKLIDRDIQEAVLEIVGVSEMHDKLILLDSHMDEYIVPVHFYAGTIEELANQLPLQLKLRHICGSVLHVEPASVKQVPPDVPCGGSAGVEQVPPDVPCGGSAGVDQVPPDVPSGGSASVDQVPPYVPSGGSADADQGPPDVHSGGSADPNQVHPEDTQDSMDCLF